MDSALPRQSVTHLNRLGSSEYVGVLPKRCEILSLKLTLVMSHLPHGYASLGTECGHVLSIVGNKKLGRVSRFVDQYVQIFLVYGCSNAEGLQMDTLGCAAPRQILVT